MFDVFLFDSDFKIEQPKRYSRKGLHLLNDSSDDGDDDDDDDHEKKTEKGKGKKVDCLPPGRQGQNGTDNVHFAQSGDVNYTSTLGSIRSKIPNVFKRKVPDPEEPSLRSERGQTLIPDPSTSTNPEHTFYIENGQMKLKISAKNGRQMLQWITALEKAAAACHFTGRSRFDSFAPTRTNVAAQWLVDGVSSCSICSSSEPV